MVQELQYIEEFYADRVIFLTGASGFLGKITLEKLLRSCPRIKKIYILLRSKHEKDCAKRFEAIFDSVIFENLRRLNPNYKDKVEIIVGDCCLPDMALRPEMRSLIISEVDVILHFAATVKFDENLKVATNINVRALRDLLKIAREMPQLKSFLYVSTAFSNCIRHDIDEIFYDTPINGAGLISMMEALDSNLVAEITPSLLRNFPNTYVFTKAVAENLVRDEGRGLPIGIIRPSIASYREPVPGWIDNVYGATGILLGSAMGLIRILQTDLSCTAEMIPADYVVNTALVAVVDIHHQFKINKTNLQNLRSDQAIPIYNIVSSTLKYIDWKRFMELSEEHCMDIPSPKVLWHSHTFYTPNYYLYKFGAFFLHTIPAHLIDLGASLLGKKPMMVKGYQKIHKFSQVISYFSTRSWKFHNGNVQKLFIKMKIEDRSKFDFNIACFEWSKYFHYYIQGGRTYILRDTMDTVPEGKRKLKILRIAHYSLCGLLLYALYQLFIFVFGSVM